MTGRMTGDTVLEILRALRAGGIDAWVDGGWGVDALVGRQTRPHDDLDLVVRLDDVDRIRTALALLGFAPQADELPTRFVLADPDGQRVDLHTVRLDGEGGGVQTQPGGGAFRYPPQGFTRGRIEGQDVGCVSAEVQLLCHLGYAPREADLHDVKLLHDHFDLPLPEPYQGLCADDARSGGRR